MTVTVTVLDWPESAACVVCASCAMVGGVSEARLGVERIFTPRVTRFPRSRLETLHTSSANSSRRVQ